MAGWEAVSNFIVARNVGASLMGSVVAFCIEKSCRPPLEVEEFVKSTEKDKERTSALKSEFTLGSELPNRMTAG